MVNRTNCDRKPQLSEILTEPLNPRDLYPKIDIYLAYTNITERMETDKVRLKYTSYIGMIWALMNRY